MEMDWESPYTPDVWAFSAHCKGEMVVGERDVDMALNFSSTLNELLKP
jgi:hypothetical protein